MSSEKDIIFKDKTIKETLKIVVYIFPFSGSTG